MEVLVWILTLAIASGQIIRIPVGPGGITTLDITVLSLCFFGIIKNKFKLTQPPPQIKAVLIFLLIATISLSLSPLHLKANEYLISFSYTLRIFIYVFFVWIIFSNAFGNFKTKLPQILLLSGISLATLGLLQFIFFPDLSFLTILGWDPHYFRTVSTFLDPNFAGGFFVLTLLLIFQNLEKDKKWSIFFFAVTYLALLTTFSRSSYLMLLVSGCTISYLRRSKIILLFTTLLFLGLMLGFYSYNQSIAVPRGINREQSASFRFNTWQQGFFLFQNYPVLGIGFNAYRYGLDSLSLGDDAFIQSHGSSSNDSSLLSVASTTGIIGLIAYCYFLWTLTKVQKKNIILISGLTGLILHSFFANSLFYPPILAWILLISISSKE